MTGATITVRVPLAVRKRGGRKLVVLPDGALARTAAPVVSTRGADPALVKALARAFRWQKLLDEGRYASITELAAAERIERGFLGKMLQLTLLAPELVEAILDGRAPDRIALPSLLGPFPNVWAHQTQHLTTR